VTEFVTPKQLSKLYPVSLSTIYEACKSGLPHYRIPAKKGRRGKYLIRLSDWVAWMESHRHEGPEAEDEGELTFLR